MTPDFSLPSRAEPVSFGRQQYRSPASLSLSRIVYCIFHPWTVTSASFFARFIFTAASYTSSATGQPRTFAGISFIALFPLGAARFRLPSAAPSASATFSAVGSVPFFCSARTRA